MQQTDLIESEHCLSAEAQTITPTSCLACDIFDPWGWLCLAYDICSGTEQALGWAVNLTRHKFTERCASHTAAALSCRCGEPARACIFSLGTA
jgi:hypothetical protein